MHLSYFLVFIIRSGTYCTVNAHCTIDLALNITITNGMMKNTSIFVNVLYKHPMFVKTSKPYDINSEKFCSYCFRKKIRLITQWLLLFDTTHDLAPSLLPTHPCKSHAILLERIATKFICMESERGRIICTDRPCR
jgi:hypothetical protein